MLHTNTDTSMHEIRFASIIKSLFNKDMKTILSNVIIQPGISNLSFLQIIVMSIQVQSEMKADIVGRRQLTHFRNK